MPGSDPKRGKRHSSYVEYFRSDAPSGVTADGLRFWNVRCKIPFEFRAPGNVSVNYGETFGEKTERTTDEDGTVGKSLIVQGVASSTSVDFYGTRMAKEALDIMAAQMSNGLAYIPRHRDGFASIEWDGVIGRTVGASVEAAEVKEAKHADEKQYILTSTTLLFPEQEKSKELAMRLDRGEPIGQSIGGWFNRIQIVSDEEGEVQDIIVLDVGLDHLAVTRGPANPDSDALKVVRAHLSRMAAGAVDERSIVDVSSGQEIIRAIWTGEPAPLSDTEVALSNLIENETPAPEATVSAPAEPVAAELSTDSDTAQHIDISTTAAPAATENENETSPQTRSVEDSDPDANSGVDVGAVERTELETPEETSMPTLDIDAISAAMRTALEPINDRLSKLEDRSDDVPEEVTEAAAAPTSVETELQALRDQVSATNQKLERSQEALVRSMTRPARRGKGYQIDAAVSTPDDGFSQLVGAARDTSGATALAAVANASKDVLFEKGGASKVSTGDLQGALAAACRAAGDDGIFTLKGQW